MNVWRVEHPDTRKGPYTSGFAICRSLRLAHSNWAHPPPTEDFGFDFCIHPDWVSGFTDEEAVAKWFGHWLEDLAENGFRLYLYDVPQAAVMGGMTGTKQYCFHRDSAALKEVRDVSGQCD